MNEDKDIDPGADLRRAYADLSTEVTPPALDAKILDAAQPNARLSNLLSLKPLSWAAITILSIGLVLELQRSAPEPDAVLTEPAMPVDSADLRLERQVAEPTIEAEINTNTATGYAAEAPIAAPVDRSMQKAQEAAAVLENLDRASVQPAAQLYEDLDDLQAAPEPERFCEESETVDAGSWYLCVLRLREEGRDEQAAFELSLLKSRFPDFEIR